MNKLQAHAVAGVDVIRGEQKLKPIEPKPRGIQGDD